ncbi:MAG: hypothetical protein JGK17_31005 [Microcoleus sp. PH2017_10_PVI_O_A]|uniref:hypothetical protein n=1 Tax=unclassified Microcoleus TaxID=2642155 RepID=UPI001D4BC866|nr:MULTISPECIES: hypothetical protein [unclassified Microcoleus]MCC3409889.1 hypothetical protein [Microcoleus sp. PH2017_10_PVI_O_A]MCC3464145.1 hypothetical protein [Microcoleus sp. PH2017_11_PCY_U_A]MCC3482567.1 hypothetical protein [Microcoleus sp. PH2017_12_PCY_D_A]MCC3563497.1 hypothetical protein [Microcoleus sp. PH2017_27_LUM_O_A]
MKRVISFLATLMVAFVVTFGFVVNSASAETIQAASTVYCDQPISASAPCTANIRKGDVLVVSYEPGIQLNVVFSNAAQNQAKIAPKIGAVTKDDVLINSLAQVTKQYDTLETFMASFENKSTDESTMVIARVTKGS